MAYVKFITRHSHRTHEEKQRNNRDYNHDNKQSMMIVKIMMMMMMMMIRYFQTNIAMRADTLTGVLNILIPIYYLSKQNI